jgi:uncharacterized protein (DUF983 family)
MASLYCLNCGHEFPAEGAKKKPDRVGLIIFTTIGVLVLLFGVLCFAVVVPLYADRRMDFMWYGVLAILAGLGGIGIGRGLGKGVYSFCPSCGKGMALPSESRSAQDVKRKKGSK